MGKRGRGNRKPAIMSDGQVLEGVKKTMAEGNQPGSTGMIDKALSRGIPTKEVVKWMISGIESWHEYPPFRGKER